MRTRLAPFLFAALFPAVEALVLACGQRTPNEIAAGDDASDGSMLDGTVDQEAGGDASPPPPGEGGGFPEGGGEAGGITVMNATMVAGPNSVLSAVLTFLTSLPATATFTIAEVGADAQAMGAPEVPPPDTVSGTAHAVNLIGLRPGTTVVVTINAAAGTLTGQGTVTYTVPALPQNIPTPTVVQMSPSAEQPGYTYMTLWYWSGNPAGNSSTSSSIVALDAWGRVVWYYDTVNTWPWDVKKLPNGHLFFLDAYSQATEIDVMGNVVQTYSAAAMGLSSFEEEILPEDGGNYLSLSTQLRASVPSFPGTGAVVGDLISEFTPGSAILQQWATLDMLDAGYTTPASFSNFWGPILFPEAGVTNDWSHGDSLSVDPADQNIVASLRNLNWIIKYDRGDGGVLWRLGQNGDFTLTSPDGGPTTDSFPTSQYAATVTPTGTILCWDGNPSGHSRAVELAVDPRRGKASIVWQYQDPTPFFSPYGGNASLLANGDVLVNDGFQLSSADPTDPTNLKTVRLLEVTHTTPATTVAEFDINPPLGNNPAQFSGFSAYRAIRVPSLY